MDHLGTAVWAMNQVCSQIQSEEMARKIEQLPRSTIFKMITLNPHILANLPSHKPYPTQRLVRKLINDKAFIQAIPVEILALLAGSSFRHQVINWYLYFNKDFKANIHCFSLPNMTSHESSTLIPDFLHWWQTKQWNTKRNISGWMSIITFPLDIEYPFASLETKASLIH